MDAILGDGLSHLVGERADDQSATFCGCRERVAGHAEPPRCLVDGECADACRRGGAPGLDRRARENALVDSLARLKPCATNTRRPTLSPNEAYEARVHRSA